MISENRSNVPEGALVSRMRDYLTYMKGLLHWLRGDVWGRDTPASPSGPPGRNTITEESIRQSIPIPVVILWSNQYAYCAYGDDAIFLAARIPCECSKLGKTPCVCFNREELYRQNLKGARAIQRKVGRQIVLVQ